MKKLYIITAFVAILCFGLSTAMAQNNDNNNPTIVKFVKQYFPKANILTVKTDWDDYEVRLSDGTHKSTLLASPNGKKSTANTPPPITMCPINSFPNESPIM